MGAKLGLTPTEILDLEFWQFCAMQEGYQDHINDLNILSVPAGYWAAYYSKSKHPKKPGDVIAKISTASKRNNFKHTCAPAPDVQKFKERESRRLAYIQSQEE